MFVAIVGIRSGGWVELLILLNDDAGTTSVVISARREAKNILNSTTAIAYGYKGIWFVHVATFLPRDCRFP